MLMMKDFFRSIIFDFDYTLADSSKGVIECTNFALSSLNLPVVSAESVCRTIGLSLPEMLKKLAGEEHADLRNEFTRLFTKRADEVMANMTVLYSEVPETMNLLKQQGFLLGIVSTKYRYRIEQILKREGMLDFFDVIVGGEDVSRHKPDPEGLLAAIKKLNAPKANSVYVGDSVTDAETARNAVIPFIAVLSGVTRGEMFGRYESIGILNSISELNDFFMKNDNAGG